MRTELFKEAQEGLVIAKLPSPPQDVSWEREHVWSFAGCFPRPYPGHTSQPVRGCCVCSYGLSGVILTHWGSLVLPVFMTQGHMLSGLRKGKLTVSSLWNLLGSLRRLEAQAGVGSWPRPCLSQDEWRPHQCLSHEEGEDGSNPLSLSMEVWSGMPKVD